MKLLPIEIKLETLGGNANELYKAFITSDSDFAYQNNLILEEGKIKDEFKNENLVGS